MAVLTRPEDIVVEFLRANLTDPRGRHSSESDSFTASSSQTDFTLTPSNSSDLVRAITSVTVNGLDQSKWQDYDVDLVNKKIVFGAGLSNGETVVVDYLSSASGEEWIYPDFPIDKLGKSNFPRIAVQVLEKSAERNGTFDASVTHRVLFQVDCFVKDGYSKTIGGVYYSKQHLAEYLGHQVEHALIDSVNELFDLLYDYEGVTFGNLPFEEDAQRYRHSQRFVLYGTNVGH